jgi:hypothetical protein
LASVGTFVLPLPATIAGAASGSTDLGGVVYAIELLVLSVISAVVLVAQWRRLRAGKPGKDGSPTVIFGYAGGYLAVMAVLWLTALPSYFGAVDGVTANGDPIGSLWYTVACFVVASLSLAAAATVPTRQEAAADTAVDATA